MAAAEENGIRKKNQRKESSRSALGTWWLQTEKLFCWSEKMNILKKISLRGGMKLGNLYLPFRSSQEML